ncbi:glycosyl hydrolase [candidate division KSB1 bacterium]
MIEINSLIKPSDLLPKIERLFELSGEKIQSIQNSLDVSKGAPVFTVNGTYTSKGWTEWTQGFLYGSAILQYDATDEEKYLKIGRDNTLNFMASHLSHTGVHDHGFNNISTYGNLLRLILEDRIKSDKWERHFYELALKVSGAVQAARWTELPGNLGYIYSFNGPHSLFSDTVRSLRVLAVSYKLGHVLMGERDRKISLLERLLKHAETTARFNVYFGKGRDLYDICGRVVHESIFNLNDFSYRCPSTQQGYSPFSTWTRGLAWIITGYSEQLEFVETLSNEEIDNVNLSYYKDKKAVLEKFLETAQSAADFYIENTPTDGIPYWDTGAPGLTKLGDYLNEPAKIDNDYEPVDSSAAAIAAQGFLRLGNYLKQKGKSQKGDFYCQAAYKIAFTLFSDNYVSLENDHQGLILHSVYHRPNGWDFVPDGKKIPMGESTMWGDYHASELALMIKRMAENKPYLTFFGCLE